MKKSAGILVFRINKNEIEILLVHPGGPFWKNKDLNVWSIPKGELENNEDLKEAAIREFEEETGLKLTDEDIKRIFYLGEVKSQNKIVYVFALEKNFGDNFEIKSTLIKIRTKTNNIRISSRDSLHKFSYLEIPEVDKAQYFDLQTAKEKLVNYQKPILKILKNKIFSNQEKN
ncbi:MAG: NTP pyrophosphohydrolase [Candidatus Parcubacteria bacterium]|nr:MAG: NTP pyrophosphohydrolase [Candidatus Parcubacteria bacterium]